MTRTQYTIALSNALRTVNLTHQLFDVLTATAAIQAERGHASKPSISLALGCTYMNINLHIMRNQDLFLVDQSNPGLAAVRLSPDGLSLLAKVKAAVERREMEIAS
jgi:type II secretory pathway component PulC